MRMDYDKKGNEIIFNFSGDFIAAEIGQVRDEIKKLIDKGIKSVIFDFNDVNFIDSAGIGFVVATYKHLRERNCSFMIKNIQPKVKKFFQLTKIDKILKISD